MIAHSADLMLKLWEIFPDSFSVTKTAKNHEYKPDRFGVEEIEGKEETAVLAENILSTANAILIKYGQQRAMKYLDEFKPVSVQEIEIKVFLHC